VCALVVIAIDEVVELSLLLQEFCAAGLVASFFNVKCMRSWRPFAADGQA
jgi:hypothetical protein